MNTRFLIAAATLAVAASGIARADDADPRGQYAHQIDGQRTRAEVMAEAAKIPATRSLEPNGSRVLVVPKSELKAQTVRAEAAEALRLGKIPSGERSF